MISSGLALAQDDVEIFVPRHTFSSFEEYADFRDPRPVIIPLERQAAALKPQFIIRQGFWDLRCRRALEGPAYIPAAKVAGITPSFSDIVLDLHQPRLPQRPVYSREALVAALQEAGKGKTGPFLLVADQTRVRLMELKEKP